MWLGAKDPYNVFWQDGHNAMFVAFLFNHNKMSSENPDQK